MQLSEQSLLELAAQSPEWLLDELDKADAEESLRLFGEYVAWPVLEPGRPFVPGPHIDCICIHLTAVSRGQIQRLNMNVPPGVGKSVWVDAIWPAWEWGPFNRPDLRYVSASYSHDLTIRNNRRTKAIIQSPRYQRMWGDRFKLNPEQNAKTRFDNDHMGFKIATSVGGLGVGERGDRFIIDDGNNIKDVESDAVRSTTNLWVREIVPTRVNDPARSAFVNIQQRTHTEDVTGTILEAWPDVVNVVLPMEFDPKRRCSVAVTGWEDKRTEDGELLWPERYPRAEVEKLKKTLGSYAYAGQFDQSPSPRGGGMFRRTWWNFFKTGFENRPPDVTDRPAIDLPSRFDWCLISVDASFKENLTKGSRVGMLVIAGRGAQRFILDNRTAPMTFTKTCSTILELVRKFNGKHPHLPRAMKTLIEDKANGTAIVDSLMTKVSGVIAVTPEGGKEARANVLEAPVEAGQWYLPEGAPWVDDFISEFAGFPTGARDDQVDATSQAEIHVMTGADVARIGNLAKM